MITFYHAPQSRSGRIHWLLHELAVPFDLVQVSIPRRDGTGKRDPRNPHPEGKVPAIVHNGALVTETSAILLYLTDLFPEAGLGIGVQEPRRADYLTWLFWYSGVVEPVYLLDFCGFGDNPVIRATYRGPGEVASRLIEVLRDQSYLLGSRFTAADLLLCSPYLWFPESAPDHAAVQGWIRRCAEREAYRTSVEEDGAL